MKLRKGNESYEKTQSCMEVSQDIKMDIVDKVAQVSFDINPDHDEPESTASTLILKYPRLREAGKSKCHEG